MHCLSVEHKTNHRDGYIRGQILVSFHSIQDFSLQGNVKVTSLIVMTDISLKLSLKMLLDFVKFLLYMQMKIQPQEQPWKNENKK